MTFLFKWVLASISVGPLKAQLAPPSKLTPPIFLQLLISHPGFNMLVSILVFLLSFLVNFSLNFKHPFLKAVPDTSTLLRSKAPNYLWSYSPSIYISIAFYRQMTSRHAKESQRAIIILIISWKNNKFFFMKEWNLSIALRKKVFLPDKVSVIVTKSQILLMMIILLLKG